MAIFNSTQWRKERIMDNTQQLLACLKPVESSMFSKAGYSEDYWTLVLAFKSSKEIKAYKNCAPEVADEALSDKSLGSWWNKHIKGNPAWEAEIIGVDETAPVEKAKTTAPVLGVIDSDIKLCEPGWNGTTIDPIPLKQMSVSEVANWPQGEEAELALDAELNQDDRQSAMTTQTHGELLGAWTAPESAAEALDLMSERSAEIKLIIQQSKSTGEQALTVRVTDADSHKAASETLATLVKKKDTTTALLEPFRVVLFSAYEEARGYKAAALTPLEAGEKHIKLQLTTYTAAQERIRQQQIREDNERREREARELQEAEAARIKLADVQDAIDEGDEQRAQTLFDAPAIQVPRPYIAPTYIAPAAPKVEGQSTSTTWKVDRSLVEDDETGQAYVASITKLLAAVKVGTYPIEQAAQLLQWDFSAADKLAGALMAAFSVPGLQAGPQSTLRVSRGRKKK
jgi:hypothetical protein